MDTLYAEVYAESTALPRASKNGLRQNFFELRKLYGWKIVEVWGFDARINLAIASAACPYVEQAHQIIRSLART